MTVPVQSVRWVGETETRLAVEKRKREVGESVAAVDELNARDDEGRTMVREARRW